FGSDGGCAATLTRESGGQQGEVRLWDLATGSGKRLEQESPHQVVFDREGRHVIVAGSGGGRGQTRGRIWAAPARPLVEATLLRGNLVDPVSLSPDGKVVQTAEHAEEGLLRPKYRFWDVATGRPLGLTLEDARPVGFGPTGASVWALGAEGLLLYEIAT